MCHMRTWPNWKIKNNSISTTVCSKWVNHGNFSLLLAVDREVSFASGDRGYKDVINGG